MPYSLPDYAVLQTFAQNLKIFFESKRRYNPLPYVQLRQQVQTLRTDYVHLAQTQDSVTAQVAEVLLPAKRLRQIACIQQVCKDLPPEEGQQSPVGTPNNTVLLACVMYRYLRLKNEYNKLVIPGAGFFDRVSSLARAAAALVVDRSVEKNCKLFNLLQKILQHPAHNRLDSLTIKSCLEAYFYFIQSLPPSKLAGYEDIVLYEHEGKEGYLRNIQMMIDDYQSSAQVLETEIIHIALVQSIAKVLQQWDEIWIPCIESSAKEIAALTPETLSEWLHANIHDNNLLSYLDTIITHRFDVFAQQAQRDGLVAALGGLWNINKQYALLGAYFFIYQSLEQTERVTHMEENHQPFFELLNPIQLGPSDRRSAEASEEYWSDQQFSYQALELFFSVPTVGDFFVKDSFAYWGGIDKLRSNIQQCGLHAMEMRAEPDYVIVGHI